MPRLKLSNGELLSKNLYEWYKKKNMCNVCAYYLRDINVITCNSCSSLNSKFVLSKIEEIWEDK